MAIRSIGLPRGVGMITAIFFLFSIFGCASIIKGSAAQPVSLKTTPADAKCELTDLRTGSVVMKQNSPIMTQLKRDSGYFKNTKYRFSCEKDGFKQNQVDFESTANGWYLGGNLLLGGFIGWLIVDPASGAMWSFASDDITLVMELQDTVSSSAEEKRAVLATTSYFQGTWIGAWKYSGESQGQDVTIIVGKKNSDGTFDTEYSWGYRQNRFGSAIFPGKVKVKGRENKGKYEFEYSNPNDLMSNSIVMTKAESGKVKAKMEGSVYNAYQMEVYLTRK